MDDAFYTSSDISTVKGIGGKLAQKFADANFHNLFDVLLDIPFRYIDKTKIVPISSVIADGHYVQIAARVIGTRNHISSNGRMRIFTVGLQDDSGALEAVFFNPYPSLVQRFVPNAELLAFGIARYTPSGRISLQHPQVTFFKRGQTPVLEDFLTPVYHTFGKIPQTTLRKIIQGVVANLNSIQLTELLPAELNPFGMTLSEAIRGVHAPLPPEDSSQIIFSLLPAFKRICFEELIAYQLSLKSIKLKNSKRSSINIPFDPLLHEKFKKTLSFSLTNAQENAFREICIDLQKKVPMLRLLQGDVGSGKTLVALLACLQAHGAGCQSVLLAPTEILAEQHFKKFKELLSPLDINVVNLHSSQTRAERKTTLEQIQSGEASIIIGTHSVFQAEVSYFKLALAVIDEQHRFGIGQRIALLRKAPKGSAMHQLVMTATPIPRTQQLALYSDLDVSTLNELPSGRKPIITAVIGENKKEAIIQRIKQQCLNGAQAYWVCPHIDSQEDEENSGQDDVASVNKTYKELCRALPELQVGLLHGQLSQQQKNSAMQKFIDGETSILVATTIIEVGVDVPNASIIVIESADKLGLAQLHQLRGRVGRGSTQSYCILVHNLNDNSDNNVAKQRLTVMRDSCDGFKIAMEDLKLRGPGEIFGSEQKGFNTFKVADPLRDQDILNKSREFADILFRDHIELSEKIIKRWFPSYS
ncbi:MAG: ATP-dependent DNA helicase RecG [Succinivibrio sp.]|nr:ATP-dependent DNA helicase RecG [Succinivibrio sp.]